jgi:hypothetical protein
MKKVYIPSLFIFIFIVSCGNNASEKKLLGKWYGIENNGLTRMHFYKDSLVFTETEKESVEWNATDSKIEFSLPNNLFYLESSKAITVYYKLSKNRDTLFGTFSNSEFGENKVSLLRAKNYIAYLKKRYDIEFALPEDNAVKYLNTDNKEGLDGIYALNVFMGYSNNKVLRKTEFTKNLNHLAADIKMFKDSFNPEKHKQTYSHQELSKGKHKRLLDKRFHLRVFADKTISDSMITSSLSLTIKDKITLIYEDFPETLLENKSTDTIPIRIFRMYQSEEKQYLDVMRGKKIKTNTLQIYN